MNKLKILYITPGVFDKGGISRYNRYQIKSLIELYGQENVRVLSLFGPGEDNLKNDFEVTWHGKTNDAFSKAGLLLALLKQILFWSPDYIFIAHVNFSGFAWLFAKLCGAKTILNIYGLEVWGLLSRDAMMGLKNADCVIADCHFTADYVENKGIRSQGSVEVIWDCVDIEQFRSREDQHPFIQHKYGLPGRNSNFIILSLGRLSLDAAYKGYARLLEVFINLAAKYPSIKLVFAGKGDLISTLKQKAKDAGIENSVFFTGSIPEEEMAGIYSYAHVFSLVSHRDQDSGEGIPLTPLEAMACGVPIIVGNHDGSQEAVIEGRNGIVIDPFNLPDQERFIEKLLLDESGRRMMAAEANLIARKYFSYEEFREKHRKFLAKKEEIN